MPPTQLLQQLHALPAAARRGRRGRQGPARDRGRDAGPGRDRPLPPLASSPAAPASRSRSTAPASCPSRPSRRASPTPPPAARILVSVFFDGGIDSLSVLAPTGDPPLRAAAPDPRARARPRAPRSARTRACAGTRPPRPLADAPRRGQGLASSRRSATRARTSRTSPRATSTRSASSTIGARTGWLGRYLDRAGDDENPLQGLSLDGSLSPDAGDREQAGRRGRRRHRLRHLDRGSATRSAPRCSDSFGRFGGFPSDSGAHGPGRARRPPQTNDLREQLATFDELHAARSPTRTPASRGKLSGPGRDDRRGHAALAA